MTQRSLPIIFFPIETTVRELDGKLLLSVHLLKKNYQVVIGSRLKIKKMILTYYNCVYIAKSLSIEEEDFYVKLKSRGHKLMVLHAEGGVLYKDLTESLRYSYPEKIIHYVDVIFTYGQEISEGIKNTIKNISHDRIVVSGEPRFDLMKPLFNSLFADEVNEILTNFGKYILINTSFGLSNHMISEEFAKKLIINNKNFSLVLKSNLLEKLKDFKFICDDFVEMALNLSQQFPDLNFVLRPHPEEKASTYSDAFKGRKNLFVTNEGNVAKWIRGSLAVIHYDCTTGIEAYINGKPVFAYVPRRNDNHIAWLPIYVSEECISQEELIKSIKNVLDHKMHVVNDKQRKDDVLNAFIANVTLSTQDVVVEVLDRVIAEGSLEMRKDFINIFILRLKSIVIDNYVRLRKPKLSPSLLKLGELKLDEINRKLNHISKIENINLDFRVEKISMNLIKIMNK